MKKKERGDAAKFLLFDDDDHSHSTLSSWNGNIWDFHMRIINLKTCKLLVTAF